MNLQSNTSHVCVPVKGSPNRWAGWVKQSDPIREFANTLNCISSRCTGTPRRPECAVDIMILLLIMKIHLYNIRFSISNPLFLK